MNQELLNLILEIQQICNEAKGSDDIRLKIAAICQKALEGIQ